jgi:hypothetical protein
VEEKTVKKPKLISASTQTDFGLQIVENSVTRLGEIFRRWAYFFLGNMAQYFFKEIAYINSPN